MSSKYAFLCAFFTTILLIIFSWHVHAFFSSIVFIPIYFQLTNKVSYWIKWPIYYLQLLCWNLCVGYWMISEDLFWSWFILITVSLIMMLPFIITELFRWKLSNIALLLIFIWLWAILDIGWISVNVIWSWPVVGNLLGAYPKLIQWYGYIGVVGGSIWIMLINLLLFLEARYLIKFKRINSEVLVCLLCVVAVPMVLSHKLYHSKQPIGASINVLYLQPSLDYDQPESVLTEQLINLIKTRLDSTVNLVVSTETPYVRPVWTSAIENNREVSRIKTLLKKYPECTVMWGMTINEGAGQSANTIYDSTFRFSYHSYNATTFITKDGVQDFRVKKVLVPFSERTPYNLAKYINMKDNYTINESKSDLYSSRGMKIFPAICSELLNSFFFIANSPKSNLITIQANERCFKSSLFAINLYNNMTRIRSIENRRYIVKSSSQGFSCVITDKGDVLKSLSPFKVSATTTKVILIDQPSFYSRYPYLLISFLIVAVALTYFLQRTKIVIH